MYHLPTKYTREMLLRRWSDEASNNSRADRNYSNLAKGFTIDSFDQFNICLF